MQDFKNKQNHTEKYIDRDFPRPAKLSSKTLRWEYREVVEYLQIKKVPLYDSIYCTK